jgi:hypothetical protein
MVTLSNTSGLFSKPALQTWFPRSATSASSVLATSQQYHQGLNIGTTSFMSAAQVTRSSVPAQQLSPSDSLCIHRQHKKRGFASQRGG